MPSEWYYMSDGKQRGPISSQQLKQLVENGRLAGDDRVLKAGIDQWLTVRKVKGLDKIIARRESELQAATEVEVGSATDHDSLLQLASVPGGLADGSWIRDSHDLTDREDLAGYDSSRVTGGLPASHPDALKHHRPVRTGREKRAEEFEAGSRKALMLSVLGLLFFGVPAWFGWRQARQLLIDMRVSGIRQGHGKAKAANILGLTAMVMWAFGLALVLAWLVVGSVA